ncbi:MAG TPA: hypothetical protein ENI15_11105 [Spirochaetes bacterium]|nr:hypothetical protein [Spirochaetota bacterium]
MIWRYSGYFPAETPRINFQIISIDFLSAFYEAKSIAGPDPKPFDVSAALEELSRISAFLEKRGNPSNTAREAADLMIGRQSL